MSDSIYDPILRDLEETASRIPHDQRHTIVLSGCRDTTALLDAYSGPLPTSNARLRFHADHESDRQQERPPTGAFIEIQLPEPFARDSGVATRVVSTAYVMQLLVQDLAAGPHDPNWLAFLEQFVEHYSSLPASDAPSPLPYSVADYHNPAHRAAYAELAAVIAELPNMPHLVQSAVNHLRWLIALSKETSEGSMYQMEISISRPSSAVGYPDCPGIRIPVGEVFCLIARDCVDDDPAKAADFLALADRYYMDDELELEIDAVGREAFTLIDLEYVEKDEVEKIMNSPSAELLPGSVRLVPYTDQSRFSQEDGAFEYRLVHYLEEFDDDEDDDYECEPEERALLIGPEFSYRATITRSDSRWA